MSCLQQMPDDLCASSAVQEFVAVVAYLPADLPAKPRVVVRFYCLCAEATNRRAAAAGSYLCSGLQLGVAVCGLEAHPGAALTGGCSQRQMPSLDVSVAVFGGSSTPAGCQVSDSAG